MYAHVYTCTHCGRTGHLVKFCYDRINNLNFTNKFVWIRKGANPLGPKRKCGYQKPLLYIYCRCGLSHDVKALVPYWWMRSEPKDHIYGCIIFKECLGGKNHHGFGDVETSSYDLVTSLNSHFCLCINIDILALLIFHAHYV